MSFCTFSATETTKGKTYIDNLFITNFLAESPSDAVKVYLYGLFLCQNNNEMDLSAFSEMLSITESEVVDYFKYWDEFGVLTISSLEPFKVVYHHIDITTTNSKYNSEKYKDFSKNIQLILNERMISVSEYQEYFSIMENYNIKSEVLEKIINFCADIKGKNISSRYIIKVVKDWISRGLTSNLLVDKEIESYKSKTSDINILASKLNISKVEIDDIQNYKKWTEKYGFEKDFIFDVAIKNKIKTFKKLDSLLEELFSNKCFTLEDCNTYLKNKNQLLEIAKEINKALGIYIELLDTEVLNFISPWTSKGFDKDTLIFIANYLFRNNKRTLDQLNDSVDKLYKLGLVTIESISEYIKEYSKNDKLISTILSNTGINRKPNEWDRNNIKMWHNWNFTDDMILEAAKRASTSNNPMQYINGILSNWKSKNIYTIESLDTIPVSTTKSNTHFSNERKLSEEEVESLYDSLDHIKI